MRATIAGPDSDDVRALNAQIDETAARKPAGMMIVGWNPALMRESSIERSMPASRSSASMPTSRKASAWRSSAPIGTTSACDRDRPCSKPSAPPRQGRPARPDRTGDRHPRLRRLSLGRRARRPRSPAAAKRRRQTAQGHRVAANLIANTETWSAWRASTAKAAPASARPSKRPIARARSSPPASMPKSRTCNWSKTACSPPASARSASCSRTSA